MYAVTISLAAAAVFLWFVLWYRRRSIPNLSDTASLLSVAGVLLGFIVVLQIGPTLVRLQKEPEPRIEMVRAVSWVGFDEPRSLLVGKVEGYVVNKGTATATGLALEFRPKPSYTKGPWPYARAYLFSSHPAVVPSSTSIDWKDDSSRGDTEVCGVPDGKRIMLPPIPPDHSVGFILGLPRTDSESLDGIYEEIVSGKMEVVLLQLDPDEPDWYARPGAHLDFEETAFSLPALCFRDWVP